MKRIHLFVSAGFIIFCLSFTGCFLHFDKRVIPLNDEILIFPKAYDLVYLRTLEAVQNVEGWELEETEKEKGLIKVRNILFSRADDSDRRMLILLVERTGRKETAVRLAPESQRTTGGDLFLQEINETISRDL